MADNKGKSGNAGKNISSYRGQQKRSNSPRYSERYGANRPNPYTGFLPPRGTAKAGGGTYHPESINYSKRGELLHSEPYISDENEAAVYETAQQEPAPQPEPQPAPQPSQQQNRPQNTGRPAGQPGQPGKQGQPGHKKKKQRPQQDPEELRLRREQERQHLEEIRRDAADTTAAEILADTIAAAAPAADDYDDGYYDGGSEAFSGDFPQTAQIRLSADGRPMVAVPVAGEDGRPHTVWMPVELPPEMRVEADRFDVSAPTVFEAAQTDENPFDADYSGDSEQVVVRDSAAAAARAAAELKAAEAARAAEEAAKAAEEARLAEEAKAAEEARLAEEAKAAEEARLAEEAKAAEEARLAEEAKAAEEARLAEEAKAAEEARLAEEAKAAEEARLAEEAKAAEEARLAEEAKAAEEARLAEEAKAAEEAARAAEEAKAAEEAAKLAEAAAAAELLNNENAEEEGSSEEAESENEDEESDDSDTDAEEDEEDEGSDDDGEEEEEEDEAPRFERSLVYENDDVREYTPALCDEDEDTDETGDGLFLKRKRPESSTTVFDLPEGVKLPAYIDDEDFLERWLEEEGEDDLATIEKRKKRRISALIGTLTMIFALIGFVWVLKYTLGAISGLGNTDAAKAEYAEFISPVVMSEVAPFETWDAIPADKMLQSAIFQTLTAMDADSYQTDDTNKLIIPSNDVLQSAQHLYGKEVTMDVNSFNGLNSDDLYYSDTDDCFHVAATGISGPQPDIAAVSKRSGSVTLTVGYIEETGSANSADYFMMRDFVLTETDDGYYISAIREVEDEKK